MTSKPPDDPRQLFDAWAETYDTSVQSGHGFPFAGYDQVLDAVLYQSEVRPGMHILDLGIGTGNLARRFLDHNCHVCGIDVSPKMLATARQRLPGIQLVEADLQGKWPAELGGTFDRIISGYALHHFDLAAKIDLLQRLTARLRPAGGRIVVGDIAFETAALRAAAYERWRDLWDPDEYYWAADETRSACERTQFVMVAYTQVSSCGGVFVFQTRVQAAGSE